MHSRTQHTTFIGSIVNEVTERGNGVAMLIGSGISAASGILMGQEFSDYLAYAVDQVLLGKWDIRQNGWPKHPDRNESELARNRLLHEFVRICELNGVRPVVVGSARRTVRGFRIKSSGTRTDKAAIADENIDPNHIASIDDLLRHLIVPLVPETLCDWELYASEQKRKALYQRIYNKTTTENWTTPSSSSPSSTEYVVEKAIRSLFDWRATLDFLAGVIVQGGRPVLCEHDPSVVDSFNAHITRNKRPNLAHMMITHLMRPLRSRVVLTTNFDSLLEDAFTQLNEPLTVFHVSSLGRLPSYRAVRPQDSLVKIHGGLSETRADFSLDSTPSRKDSETFASYLCGPKVRRSHARSVVTTPIPLQHLLVLGYSGRDDRTIHLIKNVLDCDQNFKLYWVCHTQADQERIETIFNEGSYRKKSDRVVLVQSVRPDLLLFELYQKLTRALPGGGFAFQYSPNVPPRRNSAEEESESYPHLTVEEREKYEAEKAEYLAELNQMLASRDRRLNKLQILDSDSGVMDFARRRFDELQDSGYMPIWLELEDYASPSALAFEILQILALKLGSFQLEHIALIPKVLFPADGAKPRFSDGQFKKHLEQVIACLGIAPNKCVLFIYGRSGAGSCAGFFPKHWPQEYYGYLEEMMLVLLDLMFRVVYLPYSEERHKHDVVCEKVTIRAFKQEIAKICGESLSGAAQLDLSAFLDTQKKGLPDPFSIPVHNCSERLQQSSKFFRVQSKLTTLRGTLEDVLGVGHRDERHRLDKWLDLTKPSGSKEEGNTLAKDELRKIQFLYAITLFRQARHITAMLSEATFRCPSRFNFEGVDNDCVRNSEASRWIEELQARKLLLVKPGGYNWCYRDCRLGIQGVLESLKCLPAGEGNGQYDFLGQMRARTHFWIADWYQKAFSSTGHYVPLIEAIYHRLECIRFSPVAKLPSRGGDSEDNHHYRSELAGDSLNEIIKSLQLARDSMKFWLAGGPSWQEFDIRGLDELKQHLLQNAPGFGGPAVVQKLLTLLLAVEREFLSLRYSLLAEGGQNCGKRFRPLTTSKVRAECELLGASFTNMASSNNDKLWRSEFSEFFKRNDIASIEDGKSDDLFPLLDQFLDPKNRAYNALPKDASRALRRRIPKWRARWWKTTWTSARDREEDDSQSKLYILVWGLSELAYFYARRAKILAHANDVAVPVFDGVTGSAWDGRKLPSKVNRVLRHWTVVSTICWLCIDLCKSLDSTFSDFEVETKVMCTTLYGLALGYLGRFSEAHRRLNEAHALLSRSRQGLKGVEFAAIHLRRAEVYLAQTEGHSRAAIEGKEPLIIGPLQFALIDDAWACLEKAERVLSVAHSNLWSGRLYSLQLRTLSLFRHVSTPQRLSIQAGGRLPLPLRMKVQYDAFVVQLVRKALLAAEGDVYRTLRLVRYFKRIPQALTALGLETNLEDAWVCVRQRLETIGTPKQQLVRAFARRVGKEKTNSAAEMNCKGVESDSADAYGGAARFAAGAGALDV